jgi:hypothetical protein
MNKMATTGISLLPSREQGIACSARRCPRPDAPRQTSRLGVARRGQRRARAGNTPAYFRRGDGPQAAPRAHAPSLALLVVMQPGCCRGLTFHPDRG